MRLRLTVTSEEQFDLGHRARAEFDTNGGTIGRNAGCTWVLPDGTHTISSRHAAISHNGRGFLITDTSTNGVYVNTVEAPVGRGNTSLLASGDTLYMGNYVLSVEVVEDAAEERRRLGVGSHGTSVRADANSGPPPSQAAAARADANALMASLAKTTPAATAVPTAFGGSLGELPGAPSRSSEAAGRAQGGTQPFDPFLGGAPLAPQKASPLPPRPTEPPLGAALPAPPVAVPRGTGIPDDFFADLMGLPGRPPSPPAAPGGGLGATPARSPIGSDPLRALGGPSPIGLPPAAPTIPASFDLNDAFGKNPGAAPAFAPLPPLPGSGSTARGKTSSWPDPIPVPAPQPFATPSPLPAPLPPPAADAPEPKPPRRPISEALSADLVALRLPGSESEPTSLPTLDPVAVLRRRGAAVGAAASPSTAMPASTLSPLPLRPEVAAREPAPPPRFREMPLPQSPVPAPQGAAPPAPAEPVTPASTARDDAFWRGLGLDPAQIPPETRAQLLGEFGKALREALNGLVPILGARRSLKDELRIDQTRLQPRENNPLKFLPSGDAVLQALMARDAGGFLPLSKAVREGFEDVRAHEVAAVVALDAVIGNLLGQFDPSAMEQSGTSGKLFGRGPDKAKLWDRFVSLHSSLVGNLEETTRKLVAEEFARAYAQQVENLRRGAS